MKNILTYILSLVIFFGVVPINGQEAVTQTCNTTEVRECCQVVLSSSEDIKKKKKKGKKIKKGKKGKKKGFFSKIFGSK
jgi:hypothetical protein